MIRVLLVDNEKDALDRLVVDTVEERLLYHQTKLYLEAGTVRLFQQTIVQSEWQTQGIQ